MELEPSRNIGRVPAFGVKELEDSAERFSLLNAPLRAVRFRRVAGNVHQQQAPCGRVLPGGLHYKMVRPIRSRPHTQYLPRIRMDGERRLWEFS